jgi:nucleoside 2-deoxyribosyltransferase
MQEIFQANLRALGEAEMMVSLLDGPQVDDGTAWEVGFFFSQGKKGPGPAHRPASRRGDGRLAGEPHDRMLLP